MAIPSKDLLGVESTLSTNDVHGAGAVLVNLASKDSHRGQRRLFQEEMRMLEDCFERGMGRPNFKQYHVEAVHQSVESSNLQMAKFLLSRDSTYQLLRNDQIVLLLTLRKDDRSIYRQDNELLQEMMSLVIDHGARINAADSNGDTALYLTCEYGLPQAFFFLLEAGADSSTSHHRRPIKRTDSGSSSTPAEPDCELNLLQVALDARLRDESFGPANSAYKDSLKAKWGKIIEYLFDAGMRTANDDAALAKLLHIACYQGHFDYVQMILRHGVDVHAKAARIDDRDTVYGSALHAAATGGHREIVLRLLAYGANPRTARLQEYMKPFESDETLTPIAAALRNAKFDTGVKSQEVLDACQAIIESGVTEADRKLLAVGCAKSGSINMLSSLLQPGLIIDRVPLCSSIEAITLLLDHGATIEAQEFQKHAVAESSSELMEFLVERFGPMLTVEDINNVHSIFMRRNEHSKILDYLIRDYGHCQSGGSSLHGDVATQLFQAFCGKMKLGIVRSLLEDATSSGCPGLSEGVINILAQKLHQYWFDEYSIHGKMTKERLHLYQLLLNYSDQAVTSRPLDDRELWLTPENLPPHTYDRVNKIPSRKRLNPRSSYLEESFKTTKGFFKKKAKGIFAKNVDGIDQGLQISSRDTPNKRMATPTGNFEVSERSGIHGDSPEPMFELSPFASTAHCSLCAKNGGFTYDVLDESFAIRLLSIEPSTNQDAALRCQLMTTNLGTHPEYEALSYVWGEPFDPASITLNGVDFAITKNLSLALHRLRLPDKERRLWVDAICINQNFMLERNQQVGIMREIYQNSRQTLVWVGEEADNSCLIFNHIREWTTYRDDYNAGKTKKNNAFGEAHLNMPGLRGDTQKAFKSFCRRPCFQRQWVIQEIVVSKQALVICGQHQEKLHLVAKGASFSRSNLYDPFRGVDAVTHFVNLTELCQDRNVSLKSILQYSRFCEASDPRDKVFGLLGLFLRPLITVDYALDVRTVFRAFTEAILKAEEHVQFLNWLGITEQHVQGLQSWVPDFTASKPTGILPRVYHHTHIVTTASQSLRKLLPGWRIDGPCLHISGSHLDSILDVGDVLPANPATYPESPHFRKTMHNWERVAAGLLPHKRYATPLTEMFLKTLTGGQSASMSWYFNVGGDILRNLDEEYFNDYEVLRAWRRDGDGSDKDEDISLSHFKRQLNECCYGRRLYVTDKGSMGLAPPGARKGDLIVFFSGAFYPFVLRPVNGNTFTVMGDCYLYEPRRDSLYYDDFNEHIYYRDDIHRDVKEWVIE